MTPNRWQQVDRLLEQALEQEPGKRAEFVDKQCAGNEELQHEVKALLKAHEQAGSFIEAPALDMTVKGLAEHRTESLVGQQLGNYKILSLLGTGGMGEVYLAQDPRLGRKIALKLLPRQFTYDTERLRRFEREAQAASALNHPNILTIHEVGRAGDTLFMAAEFVDGQTLRQRILGSQLELAETLDIAIQVANALAAAHELHIVHRDIKPENIMLRRDGYVKVLDFGLAKLMEAHLSSSGTVSLLTESGMVVGTFQYMSPEQARGQEVDHRSDIFSLGVVLYEMSAGTMAFKGNTVAAVSDGILHQTPTPVRQLRPNIPEELERVIVKSLEKDRELRYQTASDLRADLKRIQRDTDLLQASKLPKVQPELIPQSPPPAINPRQRLTIAGIAVLVVALLTGWYIWQYAKPQPRAVMTQRQLTTNSPETPVYAAAISPDGRYLAYSEENALYVKQIDSGETYALSALVASRVLHVAWFPNGDRLLASATARDEKVPGLWTVPILGGQPRKLGDDAIAARVSSDGATIAFISENRRGIWLMSANGEQPRRIVQAVQGEAFQDLTWFPNSQRVAYIRHHFGEDGMRSSIESCDLSGNHTTTMTSEAPRAELLYRWVNSGCVFPDGRLLYSIANWKENEASLWEIRIDLRGGQAIEAPRNLLNWPGLGIVTLSGSSDGKRLGFFRGISQDDVYVGKLEGNGTRLTMVRRLTLDDRNDYPGAWTPDSKAVLFSSNRNGNLDVFKQALDQRFAEPVVMGPEDQCDPTLTPDGASILYWGAPGGPRLKATKPVPLRRAPIAGGPSQLVLNEQGFLSVMCARQPSNLCVANQRNKSQFVFHVFDPLRGKGRELTRIDVSPNAYEWDLSPDGSRIALNRSMTNKVASRFYR